MKLCNFEQKVNSNHGNSNGGYTKADTSKSLNNHVIFFYFRNN
jgi:hypothetical protein